MPLHRRLPKRGFTNIFKTEYAVVNLSDLERAGVATVTPEVMREKGLVRKRSLPIKVLGDGELKKKLTVKAQQFSASAKEKITKAGGTAEVLPLPGIRHQAK